MVCWQIGSGPAQASDPQKKKIIFMSENLKTLNTYDVPY